MPVILFAIILLFIGCGEVMDTFNNKYFPISKTNKNNFKKNMGLQYVKNDNSFLNETKNDISNKNNLQRKEKGKDVNSTKAYNKIILEKLSQEISNMSIESKKIEYKNKLMLLINLGPVVHFDTNQYSIKDKYKKNLSKIVKVLKETNQSILIVGHTDSRGSDRYNQALSEVRAREVYKFFLKKGFDKNKLDYIGYGEEQPIATNATPEGRAKNRRVELFVDGNITFMFQYLKNREINVSFLNNHSKLEAGHVEKTQKVWSKGKSEKEIKEILKKLSKSGRKSFNINLEKRRILIKFPTRELKEK